MLVITVIAYNLKYRYVICAVLYFKHCRYVLEKKIKEQDRMLESHATNKTSHVDQLSKVELCLKELKKDVSRLDDCLLRTQSNGFQNIYFQICAIPS